MPDGEAPPDREPDTARGGLAVKSLNDAEAVLRTIPHPKRVAEMKKQHLDALLELKVTQDQRAEAQVDAVKNIWRREVIPETLVEHPSPDVYHFDFLLGVWRGAGREQNAETGAVTDFGEEISFSRCQVQQPVVTYSSRTWRLDNGHAIEEQSGL